MSDTNAKRKISAEELYVYDEQSRHHGQKAEFFGDLYPLDEDGIDLFLHKEVRNIVHRQITDTYQLSLIWFGGSASIGRNIRDIATGRKVAELLADIDWSEIGDIVMTGAMYDPESKERLAHLTKDIKKQLRNAKIEFELRKHPRSGGKELWFD